MELRKYKSIIKNLCVLFFFVACLCAQAQTRPVQVVLFTHIEDNTPAGTLGTPESRAHYMLVRGKLIAMANLAQNNNVRWSLQPDWKILLGAFMYEDSAAIASTNGKNFLRYLKEDKSVIIDPHSHEKLGYNYTDVAHLLDSLGVGGSTVIGGHVWDPALPQFQNWDRFRVPVAGIKYPWAFWRGDILMGSGTPNHVNDPVVSGVWRPKDRYHYFTDDTLGNIYCTGQYKGDVETIRELTALYDSGRVAPENILTASIHIKPADITTANGIPLIDSTILRPLIAMRTANRIRLTDFTSLIQDWKNLYGGRAFIYQPPPPVAIKEVPAVPAQCMLEQNYPNPFNPATSIKYGVGSKEYGDRKEAPIGSGLGTLGIRPRSDRDEIGISQQALVSLRVYDVLGREVATLVNEERAAGNYEVKFDAVRLPSGTYFYELRAGGFREVKKMILLR